jgi:hypothetical protein
MKTTNNGNNLHVINHGGAQGTVFQKSAGTGNMNLSIANSSVATTGLTLNDGNWHLIVGGFDTAVAKSFLIADNGTVFLSGGVSTPYTDGHFKFGSLNTLEAQSRYDGDLDEIALWPDRRISADEVAILYNSGAGKFYPEF